MNKLVILILAVIPFMNGCYYNEPGPDFEFRAIAWNYLSASEKSTVIILKQTNTRTFKNGKVFLSFEPGGN